MPSILTYHHLAEPPAGPKSHLWVAPNLFGAQLDALARMGRRVVSLDAVRAELLGETTPVTPPTESAESAAPPAPSVALTFDDGFLDNYENALPALVARGMTATFFVVAGRIGGRDDAGHPYMSAAQLREMREAGMDIGSHTMTHPWLARIPREEARRELRESKDALEQTLGAPVRWLCYPSGSFNAAVVGEAREAGYVGACSVIRDNRPRASQLYWLPRVMIGPDVTPLRLRYRLSPLYRILHARKNRKRWAGWVE